MKSKTNFIKITLLASLLLCITSTVVAQLDPNQSRLAMPSEITKLYQAAPDAAISDDFNGSSVNTKQWSYRTKGGQSARWGTGSSYVRTEKTGSDSYVSILGDFSTGKGSGISSKIKTKYGFYMTRWSVSGIADGSNSGWHPAIWGAGCDFTSPQSCTKQVTNKLERIELDFIEAGNNDDNITWDSHLLLWKQGQVGRKSFKKKTTNWPNNPNEWFIHGLEYTENYLAFWTYFSKSKVWALTKKVNFGTTTKDNKILNAYRTDCYWMLSNKYQVGADVKSDTDLHLDYFYYYPEAGVDVGSTYRLKNEGNGKYLRGYNPNSSNKSGNDSYVTMFKDSPKWSTQKWTITSFASQPNKFGLKNLYSKRLLRGYDPKSSKPASNGSKVTVRDPKAWSTMMWQFIPVSGKPNTYYIKNNNSGLYLKGASSDNGYATLSSSNSSTDTRWKLFITSSTPVSLKTNINNIIALDEAEEVLESDFNVFPNPAKNDINIVGIGLKDAVVELTDISGKNVLQQTLTEDSAAVLNISTVQDGVYILKVTKLEGEIITRKVIIR